MIPQVAERFQTLEDQKRRFLEALGGCSAEQLGFRPQPGAWTLVQVGHHVTIAEQRTANAIKRHRGMRSGRKGLRYRLGNAALWLIFKTGLRVRNPVPEAEPDPNVDLPQLLELWDKARADLGAVLSEVKERGLEYAAFKHPVGGPFNVRQSLDFLVAHLEHHLRQVDRIRRHPDFPGQP